MFSVLLVTLNTIHKRKKIQIKLVKLKKEKIIILVDLKDLRHGNVGCALFGAQYENELISESMYIRNNKKNLISNTRNNTGDYYKASQTMMTETAVFQFYYLVTLLDLNMVLLSILHL